MYPPADPAAPVSAPAGAAAPVTVEVTEAEKLQVKEWADRVNHARKHDEEYRKRWAEDRITGKNTKSNWLVDTNNIAAIIEVLLAFLYAKDPDLSVRPSPATGKAGKEKYREFAETIQIVVSGLYRQAMLKRKAKRWIRSAMTVGIGWIKATFLTRAENDPIAESTPNDLTDNVQRAAALEGELASGECADPELTEAKVADQGIAIQAKMERQVAAGLGLDVMAPEDVIVSAECGPVENYLEADFIAFDIYRNATKAKAELGWNSPDQIAAFKTATRYTQRDREGKEVGATTYTPVAAGAEAESTEGFVKLVEIWSKEDGLVYTMIEGVAQWARKPYAPRTGTRFYPCFDVMFHPMDGERYPQSDVFMLTKLQEEYARTRSNYAEHRKRAVPGIIFDESQVQPESVKKLAASHTQEYTGITPVSWGVDLRTLFAPKTYNPVDPGLYDTAAIRLDMERVSGAQDAMQSAVAVEKTATEAKIQDTGFGARVGARRDAVEDSLTELSQYVAELALQVMDLADARRYAGDSAVWTQLSPEQAMTLFGIDVKAGSTGKPKANSDREAWGTLMPLVKETMGEIGAARAKGADWIAKPLIELLAETFKRLDDPAEVERFLPVPPAPQPVIDPLTGQPAVDPLTGQPMMQPVPGVPPTAGAMPPPAPPGAPIA